MKDNWIDILKERMADRTVTPPDGMWERISSDLERHTHRKRHAIVPAWLWSGIAACVAVAVAYVSFFTGRDKIDLDINKTPTHPLTAQSTPAPEANTDNDKNTALDLNLLYIYPSTRKANAVVPEDTTASPAHVGAGTADVDIRPTCPEEDTLTTVTHSHEPSAGYEDRFLRPGKSHRGVTVDLYACNPYVSAKNSTPHYDMYCSDASPGISNVPKPGSVYESPKSRLDGDNANTVTDAKHRQPVRFGLSVKYSFSDRFSLGTGLTYSRLSSAITRRSLSGATFDEDQTLHYLGIPVSVDFTLVSYKTLSVYLTSGLMGEKCVSEHAKSYIGVSRDVSERQWQFSAFAGAGIQFGLTRHLALYAEPLATYYFDNHSDITNIYHDRPLNLDLRLGLRLTLR